YTTRHHLHLHSFPTRRSSDLRGLRRIYAEGLTAKDMPNYRDKVGVLKDMEKNQISQLRKQLADVQDVLNGMEPSTDRYHNAKKRSEEHTSELQSLRHLVCRLL